MLRPHLNTFDCESKSASGAQNCGVSLELQPGDSSAEAQLRRILNSRVFAGAHRSQLFLRYIVEHAVAHPQDPLKEYIIALDVFDRDASYDPAVNATVRVEAGRLRSRLRDYYAYEGRLDPFVIEIPKGSYRAVIRPRQPIAGPKRPLVFVPAKSSSSSTPRPRHFWAIPVAFVVGALLGYRASR